ncbi:MULTISPECIES: I78 family peptidase inhibitor [unclassified Acinetobacter]|uniref:I78 family peptidase inhibitor n=1 Tax=unclassified Acinetobacter TaxID=196816 RepID=UPI0015D2C72F|nr:MULTISPECIES: I78 family peptidase inhibitor [unclassified Acinetobacter]
MKNVWILAALTAFMAGCSTTQQTETTSEKIGMANPASQYCVEQKGKLEIRDEANAQVGYCHLPNGQVVEEWALFRSSQTECVADKAKTLIGQAKLTEDQIKAISQAQIVRLVKPGQPVTMDYRVERVTVTVNPINQKIIQATCG